MVGRKRDEREGMVVGTIGKEKGKNLKGGRISKVSK